MPTSDENTNPAAETMEREIESVRIFDAPVELVFRAWTEPALLAQWFGPRTFTNPVCEADPRVGGKWRIVMRDTNGVDYSAAAGISGGRSEPASGILRTSRSTRKESRYSKD